MKTNQSYYENIKENSIIDNHLIYGDNLDGLNNLIDLAIQVKLNVYVLIRPTIQKGISLITKTIKLLING